MDLKVKQKILLKSLQIIKR